MFRIQSIKIINHPILKNLELDFKHESRGFRPDDLFITVIIGKNGVGKSRILRVICDILNYIHIMQNVQRPDKLGYKFNIEYCINNVVYTCDNLNDGFSNSLHFTRNGQVVSNDEIEIPQRVIASTMTITDKFHAKSTPFYRYKGIRNEGAPNTSGTKILIRKTVNDIINCLSNKENYNAELRELLKNLGFMEEMRISYNIRRRDLFLRPDMSSEMLRDIFTNWERYFPNRKSEPWSVKIFQRICNETYSNVDDIALFLRQHADLRTNKSPLTYDVLDNNGVLIREGRILQLLSSLDIITYPTIKIHKVDSQLYPFEDSSSGEMQLLCQFIGILSEIKQDSLIIIDEPENSCHPEWQMAYIDWLDRILHNYSSCHILIATHSPLILTNLKQDNSSVMMLQKNLQQGGDVSITRPSPYSWEIEEILTEVMGISSTRTKEFDELKAQFENAISHDEYEVAHSAYEEITRLLNPNNILREVMKIQMVGMGYDSVDETK